MTSLVSLLGFISDTCFDADTSHFVEDHSEEISLAFDAGDVHQSFVPWGLSLVSQMSSLSHRSR